MFKHSLATLSLTSFLCSTAYAAPQSPQPGLWETTSQIPSEQKAMFQKMPPEALKQMQKSGLTINLKAGTMSNTFCIRPDRINDWQQQGQTSQQDCDKPQISDSGNIVRMNMVCKKPQPSKMQSVITFNAARDAYQFEHNIQSEQHSMTVRGNAKRIGDCK